MRGTILRVYEYPFKFTSAEKGGWVITCRDLPEAISQAEAAEDRAEVASGCLQAALEGRIRHDMELPQPSKPKARELLIAPPAGTAAKAALYVAMREAGVTKMELARRLGVDEKEVRRMLDPGRGSKLARLAEAIEVLGRHLRIALA